MGIDYYKILGVDKKAKDDDLKKAYKKLAMKWHPDKNPENKKEAEATFKQISDAYDVLIDPQKRAIYDQYGEEVLKGQVPPSAASSSSCFPGSSFNFNPRNADDIFAEFFGLSTPSGSSRIFGNDPFTSLNERSSQSQKASPIENPLPCSLEDLYKGTTKKMKISRDVTNSDGKTVPIEEILTIEVKPGWKKGTKITFPEKGHEHPNIIPADIIFVIDEKPHSSFIRDGNDLITTHKVSLADALTGFTVHLTSLDGRSLTIPVNAIVHPGYEEIVPREGMPLSKDRTKRGNLRIRFNIKFPSRLTANQKTEIKKLFGEQHEL